MKKLLGIVVLCLLFSGSAYAEIVNLLCKKNEKKFASGEYPLTIDFINKKIIRAHTNFVMEVDENYLSAKSEEESSFKIYLLLNRMNLELDVTFYEGTKIDTKNSYKTSCKKVDKKIWNSKVTTINSSIVYLATREQI